MSPLLILLFVLGYFALLLGIAFYTSRGADNETFFIGKKKSNWLLVAYGMIGTSLSGVTFMSVPGEVQQKGFAYLQVVIGYFLGYLAVAYLLLPLYYRLNLTSIYTYLQSRLGEKSYKTGAAFFLLSRTLGASIRIYLVLIVLQHFLLDALQIPFVVSVLAIMLMILLYTFQGGVKTIVWTDTLQTTGMILALLLTIVLIYDSIRLPVSDLLQLATERGYTKIFQTDNFLAGNYFLKQIIGGAFITIAMTGMDQEMMQKNISVRTLAESRKNMLLFSVIVVIVNILFLILGAALYLYISHYGIPVPARSDETFAVVALQYLPPVASLIFIVGLVSALFPSADGALTALTSSFCIDILGIRGRSEWSAAKQQKIRKAVHLSITALFIALILYYRIALEASVISTILKIAGYTYGPLLGLFTFGMFTKRKTDERYVPWVCVISVVICILLTMPFSSDWLLGGKAPAFIAAYEKWRLNMLGGYQFGLELLPINGFITFTGLYLLSKK
ncbi:MAG: sodium:solute symporter [Chitinophagales bacterium]|nr:sodium:solute symporter [Chitinophagales bacterium]MDW8418807.1 sodium:solute symporter [Chitinophagales bacterium]